MTLMSEESDALRRVSRDENTRAISPELGSEMNPRLETRVAPAVMSEFVTTRVRHGTTIVHREKDTERSNYDEHRYYAHGYSRGRATPTSRDASSKFDVGDFRRQMRSRARDDTAAAAGRNFTSGP